MKKTFVLNTHALVSSEDSLLRFGSDNEIVIPMAVWEKMILLRNELSFGRQRIANNISEYFASFDAKKLMNKGVIQQNGSRLMVKANYKNELQSFDVKLDEKDFRVLQTCSGLKKEGKNVILISNNPLLRTCAESIGISAEKFRDELFPKPSEQYTGRKEIYVSDEILDLFGKKIEYEEFKESEEKKEKINFIELSDVYEASKVEWVKNLFLTIKSSKASKLGMFDGTKIVPLIFENIHPYRIIAKNTGQTFMLEALMSDVPIVIIKGGAGTGKTFCSLGVGLEDTLECKKYSQILISRTPDTVGNEKIGFLPGDIPDKFGPYLEGIKDNLEALFSYDSSGKKVRDEPKEKGEYYFEKGIIKIQPIGYLRGRTIMNKYFIIDETQNIDPEDIKSIVTRAAEGSKFVFLGDPSQIDNPKLNERYNGLVYLSEKMKGQDICMQITLDADTESVRSELAKVAAKIL